MLIKNVACSLLALNAAGIVRVFQGCSSVNVCQKSRPNDSEMELFAHKPVKLENGCAVF